MGYIYTVLSEFVYFTNLDEDLGLQESMTVLWLVLMSLDYATGMFAAAKAKEWSYSKAVDGAWRKGGEILVVTVAVFVDTALMLAFKNITFLNAEWSNIVAPLVMAWFIFSELRSILKNAAKWGAQPPKWLRKILNTSLKLVDCAADKAVDELSKTASIDSEGNDLEEETPTSELDE